jgi:hypothetical protein
MVCEIHFDDSHTMPPAGLGRKYFETSLQISKRVL